MVFEREFMLYSSTLHYSFELDHQCKWVWSPRLVSSKCSSWNLAVKEQEEEMRTKLHLQNWVCASSSWGAELLQFESTVDLAGLGRAGRAAAPDWALGCVTLVGTGGTNFLPVCVPQFCTLGTVWHTWTFPTCRISCVLYMLNVFVLKHEMPMRTLV